MVLPDGYYSTSLLESLEIDRDFVYHVGNETRKYKAALRARGSKQLLSHNNHFLFVRSVFYTRTWANITYSRGDKSENVAFATLSFLAQDKDILQWDHESNSAYVNFDIGPSGQELKDGLATSENQCIGIAASKITIDKALTATLSSLSMSRIALNKTARASAIKWKK